MQQANSAMTPAAGGTLMPQLVTTKLYAPPPRPGLARGREVNLI